METTEGRPYVICYLAVSLDGRLDGFEVDLERYYGIAARFEADAILSGSETAIAAIEKYGGVENAYDDGPAPAAGPSGRSATAARGRGRTGTGPAVVGLPAGSGPGGGGSRSSPNPCPRRTATISPRGTWMR